MNAGSASRIVLLVDALAARFGGTAYAVIQLVEALAERDDVLELRIVAQRDSIVARGIRPNPKVRLVTPQPWRGAELAWRIAWETTKLPELATRVQASALVSASGMVPRLPHCPVISLLSNPVPFLVRGTLANGIRRLAIARTSRRAARVYVPTRYMGMLAELSRFEVAPWGIDHTVFRPSDRPGEEILYVSDFYPHKRHDLALAAWRDLPAPRPVLRFIGNPDVAPAWFARIRATAAAAGAKVDVRVSRDELVRAYQQSRALLMPSERESFSMPLAEALACGVPAIVRDLPALRETGGPGVAVAGGGDPRSWTEAIQRVIHDDALHGSLREAGLVHAARFSWEDLATKLIDDVREGAG